MSSILPRRPAIQSYEGVQRPSANSTPHALPSTPQDPAMPVTRMRTIPAAASEITSPGIGFSVLIAIDPDGDAVEFRARRASHRDYRRGPRAPHSRRARTSTRSRAEKLQAGCDRAGMRRVPDQNAGGGLQPGPAGAAETVEVEVDADVWRDQFVEARSSRNEKMTGVMARGMRRNCLAAFLESS